MIKKEVLELRKHFAKDKSILTRIAGCYVNGEKEKQTVFSEAFFSIPEEECFKYYELFRKALSGTIGKNLLNLDFTREAYEEGGSSSLMLALRSSRLKDDALLEQFYDRIIETYHTLEHYLILLVHGAYDVPGKTSDGCELEDASEEVYDYVLCALCPVKPAKGCLHYDAGENCFCHRMPDRLVELPAHGFLFPRFDDRSSNIHGVLYYSGNGETIFEDFIRELLACEAPLPAGEQKESFQTLVSEILQEDCTYETVTAIHEQLARRVEEAKDMPEPLVIDKAELRTLLVQSGVDGEHVSDMERRMESGESESGSVYMAGNIAPAKMEIKTPNITIKVAPEFAGLIETRMVDGRKCLVIGIDDNVTVNGISVKG